MPIVVDSQNLVRTIENAPDGLRAEIGSYYSPEEERPPTQQSPSNFTNFKTNIDKSIVTQLPTNQQVLIPVKKATVLFTGREDAFRDQIQWNDYVNQIVSEGIQNLDHQFNLNAPDIENTFHKNYHDPSYEDATKAADSNTLLNYNLISYPYKDQIATVQMIADIKTTFDETSGFTIQNQNTLKTAMSQFRNRLANFSGSVNEISTKQRNIFDLQSTQRIDAGFGSGFVIQNTVPTLAPSAFPYHYKKTLPRIGTNLNAQQFKNIMDEHGKTKNIFQSIKRNLSFLNRNFNIGAQTTVSAKLYDLISIIASTSIVSITEASDEVFLVQEGEVNFGKRSERFSESVEAARFLSQMRTFIDSHSRELEEVYNSTSCETFFLGYKIEKYLDNAATQPIQTYYTNDANFFDTQLKYGRRYIYKTKVLLGILGSSYTYSNLFISQNETQMFNTNGELATTLPGQFTEISSDKYRAYVDVEIQPSFKVLEYEVDVDEVAFIDTPTLPPQVDLFNQSNKPTIEMRFSPIFAKVESVSAGNNVELMRALNPLTDVDNRIFDLLQISKNNGVNPDYFTGIYEIYRTREPPKKESDFANSYLTTVDDQSGFSFPISMNVAEGTIDNMDGFFEDYPVVNEKYYYAFRSLTYHGTPSNLTVPYEIELLRDSDEYKINVSQYRYPNENNYDMNKVAKRILKITPNIERLLFSEEESKSNWKLDDGSLVDFGTTKTFKIRVTSKHTGKKIDLNINFKLSKDDSFN
tara:strand:- start:226 stop:2478 length:2253 start_codon:yes stop_codon:yes gene_type:complete